MQINQFESLYANILHYYKGNKHLFKVRANGLSRRTSFRSQSQNGKNMSVPVSTPKSPLLMNGDVTVHTSSKAPQEFVCPAGALPGPQVAPILKRSTTSFNPPSNNFEVLFI